MNVTKASPVAQTDKIINVASVPQRSPFRYPGGKTWLVPYIRLWLQSKKPRPQELIEPFAGGAIVGLTAAFEGLADRVTLVELDPDVAAVWKAVLNGSGEWLADKVAGFKLTPENVRTVLKREYRAVQEKAFATILRNRVQRGGILAPGAGLMKNGENGRGLASRWYPETLRRRIFEITAHSDRIRIVEGDGMDFIRKNLYRKTAVFFVDPPYTVAGRRLYRFSDLDHRQLFFLACRLGGDFLMTYDNTQEIRALASEFGMEIQPVAMKNTHNSRMTELLISRDLSWLKGSTVCEGVLREYEPRNPRGLLQGLR